MPSARRRGRCTHGLDGQHQYVDKTVHGRVSENDLGQRCGQLSDRGWLKNRTEQLSAELLVQ